MTHLEKLQAWAAEIAQMPPIDRRPILLAWARADRDIASYLYEASPLWNIASEAIRTLSAELKADTPGNIWFGAPAKRNRKPILSALRIDPADPTAAFATFPFRVLTTSDGRHWIGAAVHPPCTVNPTPFSEIDITDVILWNPKTGELQLLGDDRPTIIGPDDPGDCLTVYGDGYAFFRAWAEARSEIAQRHMSARAGNWAHPIPTPADGAIPGALVIGDVAKAPIPLDIPILEAGPGIDPAQLTKAIYRRANLPRVQTRPEPIRRAA